MTPPTPREDQQMPLSVETEQEADGRWPADVPAVPGVLAYGATRAEAIALAQALAARVLADQRGNDDL